MLAVISPAYAADAAADAYTPTSTADYDRDWFFDEVRLGGTNFWQEGDEGTEGDAFINGQVMFDPLLGQFDNSFLNIFLRPRPHVGAAVGLDGGTDQVFAGVTWEVPLGQVFFLEASFGGTLHNGDLKTTPGEQGLSLGCRALFRESAGLGANLGKNWRVLATWDHSSHANLCSEKNNGLTHLGASIGYRF
jgi:hypothetical protein